MKYLVAITLLTLNTSVALAQSSAIEQISNTATQFFNRADGALKELNDTVIKQNQRIEHQDAIVQYQNESINNLTNQVNGRVDNIQDYAISTQQELATQTRRLDVSFDELRKQSGRIDQLDNKINQVSRQANDGTSAAIALASMPNAPTGRTAITAGVGYYGGSTAVAVGVNSSLSSRINVKLGVTHSSSNTGVGAGIGYAF